MREEVYGEKSEYKALKYFENTSPEELLWKLWEGKEEKRMTDSKSQDLWGATLAAMSKRVPKPSFETWIAPLNGEILDGNILVVTAKNDFQKEWVNERYKQEFIDVLKNITGQDFKIKVIFPEEDTAFSQKRMTQQHAISYMLLASKGLGMSSEMVNQLYSSMLSQFEFYSVEEAEKEGREWFKSIENKPSGYLERGNPEFRQPKFGFTQSEIPRRRLNIQLANVGVSNSHRKLKADNERLIRRLERIENGPWGLFRIFRRGRR